MYMFLSGAVFQRHKRSTLQTAVPEFGCRDIRGHLRESSQLPTPTSHEGRLKLTSVHTLSVFDSPGPGGFLPCMF